MSVSEVFRLVGDAPAIGVKLEHRAYEDAVKEGTRLIDAKVWKEFHILKHFTSVASPHGYTGGAVPDTSPASAPAPVTAGDIGDALSKMSPEELAKVRALLTPPATAEGD